VTLETHVFSIPMRTRFRGITVREGVLLHAATVAGASGALPGVRRRGRRPWLACALEALAATGPRPSASGAGQRHRARCRPRAGARDRHAPAAADRQGQGRRAGQTLAEDEARLEAVRDALGPSGRIRIDANGAWDVDTAVTADRCSTAPPAAWSTPSSRRHGRGPGRGAPPGRRADRSRRVDPPGRRSLPGPRPRGGRHRRAQGAAARRRPGLPADRGGDRPAGRGVECTGDLGRHRGRRGARGRAARAAPTPAGWPRSSCSPTTSPTEPLLPGGRRAPGRCLCTSTGPPSSASPRPPTASRPLGAAPRPARGPRAAGSASVTPRPSWPAAVIEALIDAGVTELVLAPGSRNAPLAFAAYDAEQQGCSGCTRASTSGRPASSRSA
jgi:hypothetical protein